MKILVIVNESPWGSSLGVTALRMVRAMRAAQVQVAAVFFREDGVYHALPGRAVDSGTPGLSDEWQILASEARIPLLLCSSAVQRRMNEVPGGAYRVAGLAELMEIMAASDRVVTF